MLEGFKKKIATVWRRFVLLVVVLIGVGLGIAVVLWVPQVQNKVEELRNRVKEALTVLRGEGGASSTYVDDAPLLPPRDQSFDSVFTKVVERVKPAVVTIAVQQFDIKPGVGMVQVDENIGSGFIVDKQNGLIVTNRHVVDMDVPYVVITDNNKTLKVKEILKDPVNDIALLIVYNPEDLPAQLPLGDSSNLKLGQWVVAFGTPLGRFPGTVSVGIISGLGRSLTVGSVKYENIIQTDAAVNLGNSGGPLVDLTGRVIGINFVKVIGADNISFAIPVDLVKHRLEEYREYGRFRVPFVGIKYILVDTAYAQYYSIPAGAYVVDVIPNSPADKAGIKPGDVIIEVGGTPVTEGGFNTLITRYKVGDKVELTILRKGEDNAYSQRLKVEVTLADRFEFIK